MNLLEFKKDIQSNKLKPYYIISGEEIGIISFFLKQIKKPTIRSENVLEVWRNLTSKQMISSTGNVYIVRDDDQFMKTEKVWKTAAEKIKYGTLILLITKPNKVTSFYKQNQEHWVEFERQSETQLKKYFSKQYPTLDVAHLATIIEMCNKDFDRIDNELNKISCALKGEMDSVQLPSLARGIIHTEVTYDVFNTLNNLLLKNFNSALMEVNAMLASGESMIGLLTLLYRSFVNGAKVLGSSNPTEANLGIKGFQIMLVKQNFRYNLDSAFEGAELIDGAIEGIKSGLYNESSAINILIFKLSQLY